MKKDMNNPYYNIFIIFICGALSWVASINSIRTGDGMAALVMIYLPLIITLVSIGIYLLSRLVIKKHSWVITLLACIFLLFFGAVTYFRST